VEAKLNMASQAPTEQSKKAPKMRGLKKAAWELVFLRIGVGRLMVVRESSLFASAVTSGCFL